MQKSLRNTSNFSNMGLCLGLVSKYLKGLGNSESV